MFHFLGRILLGRRLTAAVDAGWAAGSILVLVVETGTGGEED